MSSKRKQLIFGLVSLVVSVIMFTMLSHYPEPLEMTFNRPVGGEDRRVQTVRMYCFAGASKGAPETDLWCQEEILEEWADE